MKAKSSKPLIKIIGLPIRALCKARDMYVKTMINYANMGYYNNNTLMMSSIPGPPRLSSLQKSYSVNAARSCDETADLRELVRAASARSIGDRRIKQVDSYVKHQKRTKGSTMMLRSGSVAMERIDEDRRCSYFDDEIDDCAVKVENLKYVRSRSRRLMV